MNVLLSMSKKKEVSLVKYEHQTIWIFFRPVQSRFLLDFFFFWFFGVSVYKN